MPADTERVMSRGATGIARRDQSGFARQTSQAVTAVSRWFVLLALLALFLIVPSASAGTQYWLTGKGWGHGIGMSQYGAQGFAQHGYSAHQIIQYYYTGTTLGAAPPTADSIDVLLAEGRSNPRFQIDTDGASISVSGTVTPLIMGDTLAVKFAGGTMKVTLTRDAADTVLAEATPDMIELSGPDGALKTLFASDNGTTGRHYRGSLRLYVKDASISVVNHVGLDSYVRGVVPGEVPSSWLPATLQAQAIAARSYALATATSTGIYDVHCDTRSQMYVGMEAEAVSTDAAVAATPREVAYSDGAVIAAFFSSTSGGRTAAVEDVWGGSPRAYLKSVPDPYETSPYEVWQEHTTFTPAGLATRLGLRGKVTSVSVTTNKSLRAATVSLTTGAGMTTMRGTAIQFRLGLRSTFFRLITVSILPSARKVPARHKVHLTGVAPKGAVLWALASAGSWKRVGVVTKKSGAWTKTVRVPRTTIYQLHVGSRLGPAVRVTV